MLRLYLTTVILLFSISLPAVNINYNWEEQKSYQFDVETRTDYITFSTSMGVRKLTIETFRINSVFEIEVIKRDDENELIYAELNLLNFEVNTSHGNRIAALYQIPRNAFSQAITIDKQGNFSFEKKLQLIVSNKAHYLISNDDDLKIKGSHQQKELHSFMHFNIQNGTTTTELVDCQQKSNLTSVIINQEDPIIDLIPYDFLRLFVLPTPQMEQGVSYTNHQKDYHSLTTPEVIGTSKMHFNSLLINQEFNKPNIIPQKEYMNTTGLFDHEQGMMLSLKGTLTKKQTNHLVAQEIKQHTKINLLIP